MTMVLAVGPVLGLLFIPLIGSASDQCNSSYGRRRPFIWLLSVGILLALFIIPHADFLATHLFWGGRTLEIGILISGVILLDFCGQVCFTPLEALLSDLYRDEDDCSQVFAWFSFMVSLGGCIGYLLPSLDWSHSFLSNYVGGQAESLFFVLILIFIFTLLTTMKVSKETSCATSKLPVSGSLLEPSAGVVEVSRCYMPRSCFSVLKCKLRMWKSTSLVCLLRTCWSMTPAIYRSYRHVPQVMKQLCAAQLCSWIAVMSFVLFFTEFMGEGLYEGVPSALPGSASKLKYEQGIRMGSLGLFMQCATSTIFSLIMSHLVRHFGSRTVYVSSMVCFTLSALVICLSRSVFLTIVMTSLTGFAYAMLQTLPYTLTCHYHAKKEVFMPKRKVDVKHKKGIKTKRDPLIVADIDEEEGLIHKTGDPYGHNFINQNGSSHNGGASEQEEAEVGFEKRGVGLDFALLDSTFLLSQVIPSLFMGTVVQLAHSVTAYITCSAIFGALAIYLASRVVFDQKDLKC
uniref:Zgc:77158 n=2 Tax=Cynoglossus semilaevis TaxID=244447 RepID=A0A3P8X6C6_CYNSE